MFTSSPRYATLVQQVARLLEAGMREGTWRDYLPGERQLAETLQVSRRTVRGAMDILRQKGLVRTVHGTETKIVLESAQEPDAAPLRAIGLLLPQPLEELYPFATVFIDSLRTLFYNNGFRVDTHIGRSFFSVIRGF